MIDQQKLQTAPEAALQKVRTRLQREQNLSGALSTRDSLRLLAVTAELDRRWAS
jgi:hypothetical protein